MEPLLATIEEKKEEEDLKSSFYKSAVTNNTRPSIPNTNTSIIINTNNNNLNSRNSHNSNNSNNNQNDQNNPNNPNDPNILSRGNGSSFSIKYSYSFTIYLFLDKVKKMSAYLNKEIEHEKDVYEIQVNCNLEKQEKDFKYTWNIYKTSESIEALIYLVRKILTLFNF